MEPLMETQRAFSDVFTQQTSEDYVWSKSRLNMQMGNKGKLWRMPGNVWLQDKLNEFCFSLGWRIGLGMPEIFNDAALCRSFVPFTKRNENCSVMNFSTTRIKFAGFNGNNSFFSLGYLKSLLTSNDHNYNFCFVLLFCNLVCQIISHKKLS